MHHYASGVICRVGMISDFCFQIKQKLMNTCKITLLVWTAITKIWLRNISGHVMPDILGMLMHNNHPTNASTIHKMYNSRDYILEECLLSQLWKQYFFVQVIVNQVQQQTCPQNLTAEQEPDHCCEGYMWFTHSPRFRYVDNKWGLCPKTSIKSELPSVPTCIRWSLPHRRYIQSIKNISDFQTAVTPMNVKICTFATLMCEQVLVCPQTTVSTSGN